MLLYICYVRIRYFILYALSRFLLPFALKNYFAKGVSIHNSRVSSVLGFKRRLQIERRSHYVFLPLQPLAAPEPGWVCNWCKWARLGGCASHGVACYRRELLHIWLHLFFYSFEKLKDLFLSSFRLRFLLFLPIVFLFSSANVFRLSRFSLPVCQSARRGITFATEPRAITSEIVASLNLDPWGTTLWSSWFAFVTSHKAWCNRKHDIVLCIVCIPKTFHCLWFSMGSCRASQRTNHPPKVLTF